MFQGGVCYDTQSYYLFYLMALSDLYCHLYCVEGHVGTPLLSPSYTVHIRLMCTMNGFFEPTILSNIVKRRHGYASCDKTMGLRTHIGNHGIRFLFENGYMDVHCKSVYT
jgi:hypothetical protein